jgi:GAF domain-containing protein
VLDRTQVRIAAPGLDKEYESVALLQPIVETARGVFGAAASSIFILDCDDKSLVFGAVAGAGADSLVGSKFPLDTGIAGWVVGSHESLRLDDLSSNPTFSRDAAESTGYVPQALMAAPLLFEDECVGVLEVLDWTEGSRTELEDLALLGLIANQAAAAVRMLARLQPEADPYADPRVGHLCEQIKRSLSHLSGQDLERAFDMLRSVAQMFDVSLRSS